MNVYPFIEAENAGSGNVTRACAPLKLSRAAYYAHRTTGRPERRAAFRRSQVSSRRE